MKNAPDYEVCIDRGRSNCPRVAAHLRKAVRAALHRHVVPRARITVALVDDGVMAKLNRQFRGEAGTTDVLSFDLHDSAHGNGAIDGEIVLSIDRAIGEAKRRGHALKAELALYAVHGTLHLLGYDDRRKSDATRMHAMEDEILSSIGLGQVFGSPSKKDVN